MTFSDAVFLGALRVNNRALEQFIKLFDDNEWPVKVQSNLNSLNMDYSFTLADSNLFLSPYEIHLI